MHDYKAKIVENLKISKDFYKLRVSIDFAIEARGGQFLSVKSTTPCGTFLRRPFAISNVIKDDKSTLLEFIYQIRGKTTEYFSTLNTDDFLNILAPLGNGFNIDKKTKAILIAGGVGLGPMLWTEKKCQELRIDVTFIAGFRDSSYIPDSSIFPKNSIITTDDGSFGFKGNTLDYLKQIDLTNSTIYCCGPTVMMKYISLYSQSLNIPCFVSLEELMGCSLGACMGCVVDLNNDTKARVCKDGPIFKGENVKWN